MMQNYLDAVAGLAEPSAIMAILIGTLVGMLIGALPGLGATVALVLVLPFTFSMDPVPGILLLLATYASAEYGGSISSIVLGIPGTPGATATLLDGHPMARAGRAGRALGISLYSSFFGGIFAAIVLLLVTGPIANLALGMSATDYFLIGVFALLAVGVLSGEDMIRGLISGVLGLIAGTVGLDLITGESRFTMDTLWLQDGFHLIALLVGMFAVTESLYMVVTKGDPQPRSVEKLRWTRIRRSDLRSILPTVGMASGAGTVIGAFPGLGSGPGALLTYSLSSKLSRRPKPAFGKGNPNGIAAPEAANNATVGGSLIPLLTLGIPGSPAMAIVLGAFIVHGLQPGPQLASTQPVLLNSLFLGFGLSVIAMLLLGTFVTAWFAKLLAIPENALMPALVVISLAGVYASSRSILDVVLAVAVGVVFFFFKRLRFSAVPFILAFVLSPIIEQNFRTALVLSRGDYGVFFQGPLAWVIWLSMAALAFVAIVRRFRMIRASRITHEEANVPRDRSREA